jgi:hypothetical protein
MTVVELPKRSWVSLGSLDEFLLVFARSERAQLPFLRLLKRWQRMAGYDLEASRSAYRLTLLKEVRARSYIW